MTDTNTNTPHGTIASALVYRSAADQVLVWWKENRHDASLHDGMKAQLDHQLASACERFYILDSGTAVRGEDWYAEYPQVFRPKHGTRLTPAQVQALSRGFSLSRKQKAHLFVEEDKQGAGVFRAKFIRL